MGLFGNIVNSIPVVGHVKGIVHYACGDKEGGNNAMYQATRTSAVLGAGAAGTLVGGPAGGALAAAYAGTITDGVASVAMDKPQGIIKSCDNIANDVKAGKNPTGSIMGMGFQMGMDAVGGLGMGGVSSAASGASGKVIAKSAESLAKASAECVGKKAGQKFVEKVTTTVTEEVGKKIIQTAALSADAYLVGKHIQQQAKEKTEEEQIENYRREREERDRREREERERREREERERREREEQARREREEQARRQREEQARLEREEQARREREEQARRQREEQARRQREEQARLEREEQARVEREERDRRERETQEQQNQTTSGHSGSQTPQENQNNNNKGSNVNEPSDFDFFMNLLEEILQDIFGNVTTTTRTRIIEIFSELEPGQIIDLEKKIKRLRTKNKLLKEVLLLAVKIFTEYLPQDLLYTNFASVMEFITVYIEEEIEYRTEVYRMEEKIRRESDQTTEEMSDEDLRNLVVSCVMNLTNIDRMIFDRFMELRGEIEYELESFSLSPNFRDIFAAVYHYFKHRIFPGNVVLSVREYYDWIRRIIGKLGEQQDYKDLLEDKELFWYQHPENLEADIIFQIYVAIYGKRIKIIVRVRDDQLILSSCYVTDGGKKDKDGDVWIHIRRF